MLNSRIISKSMTGSDDFYQDLQVPMGEERMENMSVNSLFFGRKQRMGS